MPGGQPAWQPAGAKPPSYLVWAILTTLFCCLPLGVVSIVYAARVDSAYNAGDLAGSLQASESAKKWAIISAVTSVVLFVVWIAVIAAAGST